MLPKFVRIAVLLCLLPATLSVAQQLSPKWEELTAEDFVKALQSSSGVCVLPFGIIEKHGPSGPLGTDLINVRAATMQAVKTQYAVVFPEYYFGQIAEARHQPGTIAYHADLQLELLQATTDEMARNGCRKVMIVNGHGGNTALLQYFAQVQLDTNRGYIRRCRQLRRHRGRASITMQVNRRLPASWRRRLHWLIRREQERSPERIKSVWPFLRG